MKRIAILFSFLLLTIVTLGQDHASFKGIPINGTLDSFTTKLKAQGFTCVDSQSGISTLTGTFAAVSNSNIYVVSTNNLVWKVVVEFPRESTWVSAVKSYNEFKESFGKKYETNSLDKEYFPEGFSGSPDDSYFKRSEMYDALKKETAKWDSTFPIPGGMAVVRIIPSFEGYSYFRVVLEYYDWVNTEARDKAVIDDI